MNKPFNEKTTVLVVDDEALRLLNAIDGSHPGACAVVEVSGASKAVQMFGNGINVEIVVTDVHMPAALNGLGPTRAQRAKSPRSDRFVTSGVFRPSAPPMPYDINVRTKSHPARTFEDALFRLAA